jgi:putative sigma-54 modulation protein
MLNKNFVVKGFELIDEEKEIISSKVDKLDKKIKINTDVTIKIRTAASGDYKSTVSFTLLGKFIKGEGKNKKSPIPAVNEAIDDAIRKYRKLKDNRFEKQGNKISKLLEPKAVLKNVNMKEYDNFGSMSEKITKKKYIELRPQTIDEAIDEMLFLGEKFYMFKNLDGETCTIFKRNNNQGFGLLVSK